MEKDKKKDSKYANICTNDDLRTTSFLVGGFFS
jgi:hypothetical protein